MTFDSKVVPFDRGSAYVHHRAMKNRRDNNLLDALELLRRAVEQSPENREYRLDLAETYCEMGCHEQSSRLLLDLLAEDGALAECYYGLALNMLNMNDEEGARSALKQYLAHEPNGEHSEEVRNLRAELDFAREITRQHDRRKLRAQKIANRACDLMRDEDLLVARRLFERSLKMFPEQREMRSLYAMNLIMMGDCDAALAEADRLAEDSDASVRALCVAAQVYQLAGRPDRSHMLIERAQKKDPDGIEMRLLIYTVSELGDHRLVADLARRALFETPYDRMLLHVRAVALYKSGAGAKAACGYWTRILRIDPEDTVAAYYEDLAQREALDGIELSYIYQVSQEEGDRRLRYVAAKLEGGEEAVAEEWRENAAFRQMLKWCLESGNPHFQRGVVLMMSAMDDGEAVSTLREYLVRGSAPAEMRRYAAVILRMRGADMKKYLPATAGENLRTDEKALLERFPIAQRQMIRYAAEVLEREYKASATTMLALIWQGYRNEKKLVAEPITRTETGAATLAACWLGMNGHKVNPTLLSRQFGCSERQLRYFLDRITASKMKESDKSDETD